MLWEPHIFAVAFLIATALVYSKKIDKHFMTDQSVACIEVKDF